MVTNKANWAMLACAVVLMAVQPVFADFVKVENFDGLILGPIDEQNGWIAADATSVVAFDPADAENQVLAVQTDSTHLYRSAAVLNGTVRMMFLRFRYADQLNFSCGLSDHTHPDQFGEFEVELSMTNASSDLRINDDGTYEVLALLEPDTWYNAWILVNNVTDDSQVWLHARPGDGAEPEDQLDADGQTVFLFRDGAAADLVTFFIKTGGGSGPSGPLYLDDIYIEDTDALNLTNPAGLAFAVGDLNCDGHLDGFDIDPFVLVMSTGEPFDEYYTLYPDCNHLLADINGDGVINGFDIDAFVALLSGA